MKNNNLITRPATLDEMRKLRQNATLTGFPKSEVESRKDNFPLITHLVLQQPDGQLLAGCSFSYSRHENKNPKEESKYVPAWELYAVTNHSSFLIGMIDSFGTKIVQAYEWDLIRAAEEILFRKDPTVRVIWYDVPVVVTMVFRNHGWKKDGEIHPDDNGKPRQKMFKEIMTE